MRWMTGRGIVSALAVCLLAGAVGCGEKTGALTASQQQRLDAEGLVRRADDLMFRYTHDAGRRDAGWEDRKASILVTKQSVIIHKNEKLGLEITPRTRRFVQVRRDGERVRISAGGGGVGGELVVRAAGGCGGVGGGYPGGDQGGAEEVGR